MKKDLCDMDRDRKVLRSHIKKERKVLSYKKYHLIATKEKILKAEKISKINFLSPRNFSWKISEETARLSL